MELQTYIYILRLVYAIRAFQRPLTFLQELIYHSVAAILILVSSTILLLKLRDVKHDAYMAAGVLGLVNAVLYFISAFLAHRSYRGI